MRGALVRWPPGLVPVAVVACGLTLTYPATAADGRGDPGLPFSAAAGPAGGGDRMALLAEVPGFPAHGTAASAVWCLGTGTGRTHGDT